MNAILGYSEMILEDFADVLVASIADDISKIIEESRNLLEQIDGGLDVFSFDPDEKLADHIDATIAANLARTIADRVARGPRRRAVSLLSTTPPQTAIF